MRIHLRLSDKGQDVRVAATPDLIARVDDDAWVDTDGRRIVTVGITLHDDET